MERQKTGIWKPMKNIHWGSLMQKSEGATIHKDETSWTLLWTDPRIEQALQNAEAMAKRWLMDQGMIDWSQNSSVLVNNFWYLPEWLLHSKRIYGISPYFVKSCLNKACFLSVPEQLPLNHTPQSYPAVEPPQSSAPPAVLLGNQEVRIRRGWPYFWSKSHLYSVHVYMHRYTWIYACKKSGAGNCRGPRK